MFKKNCHQCQKEYEVDKRVKERQCYCNDPACQRSRKLNWEKKKYHENTEYRRKKLRNHSQWRKSKPSYKYQSAYRKAHPEYVERNREKQRERNTKLRARENEQKIVNPDELNSTMQIISGNYIITPYNLQSPQKIVNPDKIVVQLSVIKPVKSVIVTKME